MQPMHIVLGPSLELQAGPYHRVSPLFDTMGISNPFVRKIRFHQDQRFHPVTHGYRVVSCFGTIV